MVSFILNVLLIAMTIVFLGIWGMLKEQNVEKDLIKKLHIKAQQTIVKTLQSKEILDKESIMDLIEGIHMSVFWSRKHVEITDPLKVSETVIHDLIQNDTIAVIQLKGKSAYVLKASELYKRAS